ncbi:uncharacterized protein DEA37_0011354, partial [Paragonimus westermani]
MLHTEPLDDFRRFCQVVATAVVDLWSNEEKSPGCVTRRTPSLWPSEFVRCQTDFERVTVLMRIPSVRQFTLTPANRSSVCRSSLKSDSTSDELRKLGNNAWQRHEIPQALSFYTKAVLHAASPEKRALAFANRSCVLVRVGAKQAVLDDITHALENNYPTQKQPRLHVRRAQTLLLMKKVDEARSAFLEARGSIQEGSNSSDLDLLITNGLQRCAAFAHARSTGRLITPHKTQDSALYVSQPDPPTHLLNRITFGQEQRHNRLSTTSIADRHSAHLDEAYKIHYSGENIGWQFIANRDLPPGELVLIERPFVRRLNPTSFERDCYNCFKRSYNLYPCRGCSEAGGYQLDWDENCLLDPRGDNLLVDEQPLPASWAAACLLHHLQSFPIASQNITRAVYINDVSDSSENSGVVWERIKHDKFAIGVYPIMSFRSHSCDMNTHTVYMADGFCALFTLRQIKRGEVLTRSLA